VVVGHAEVVRIANSPVTFSNAVSRRLQIPNGLDGERHVEARRLLAPFFHPPALDALEPALSRIAAGLITDLAERTFDAVEDLGVVYAVRAASAWLGWRNDLEPEFIAWVAEHRAAGRSGQPERLAHSAARFDTLVRGLIRERRRRRACDLTGLLMTVRWRGRLITDAEVISILRNWTGGDLSSLALCVGVVLHWVAAHPDHIRHLSASDDVALDRAVDEMLRLDDPFVSNRRVAVRDTVVAGCPVRAGEEIVLDWRAANRDSDMFGDPESFDPDGHGGANVVYGVGPHVCPGRGLATRQLRILLRAVISAGRPELVPDQPPVREDAPAAGFRTLPMRVTPEPSEHRR
jgi:cytochrome P450